MEDQKINVTLDGDQKTLEILTGQALPNPAPVNVNLLGLINAPHEYLLKRKSVINPLNCHLQVNESSGILTLTVDEKNTYRDTIAGQLSLNPDFVKFGINTGQTRDTFELADFIKMNRFFFSDKNQAMKLVSQLKNFKAKVNQEMEKSDNDRGNTTLIQNQVVESNIPESFDIVIPIFKGQKSQVINIEINIDARSFACSLISPDANDIINEVRSNLVGEQVKKIKLLIPELAIIEI